MTPQRLTLPLLAVALHLASDTPADAATSCPRTITSGEVFSKPFPTSDNWYGSESLAVILHPNGYWWGMGPQLNYRDKLYWWSYGFRPGSEVHLHITGRRVDGNAPPASISRASSAYAPDLGGWAMLVAVEFPNAGCWEISGEYLGQRLTFVVEVADDQARADTPPNSVRSVNPRS